jgi:hypothetical protein
MVLRNRREMLGLFVNSSHGNMILSRISHIQAHVIYVSRLHDGAFDCRAGVGVVCSHHESVLSFQFHAVCLLLCVKEIDIDLILSPMIVIVMLGVFPKSMCEVMLALPAPAIAIYVHHRTIVKLEGIETADELVLILRAHLINTLAAAPAAAMKYLFSQKLEVVLLLPFF